MQQTSTSIDLIKYLYQETSAHEAQAVEEALRSDPVLAREFRALKRAKQTLPRVKFSASRSTLQRIKCYSKKSPCEQQA